MTRNILRYSLNLTKVMLFSLGSCEVQRLFEGQKTCHHQILNCKNFSLFADIMNIFMNLEGMNICVLFKKHIDAGIAACLISFKVDR